MTLILSLLALLTVLFLFIRWLFDMEHTDLLTEDEIQQIIIASVLLDEDNK